MRALIILFLFTHIAGDFYTQTSTVAEKKKDSFGWVCIHGLLYLLTTLVLLIPVWSWEMLVAGLYLGGVHGGIDILKYIYVKKIYKKPLSIEFERNLFMGDQLLHLAFVLIAAYVFRDSAGNVFCIPVVRDFLLNLGISFPALISWGAALLFIHRPANILIGQLITKYRPKEKTKATLRAGSFIGTVERMIMLILIAMGQFAAVGLVLTAKSIARYDQITKAADFAEYYLLGTLLSLLIVICGAGIFL